MIIEDVKHNNHKKSFEVKIKGKAYSFPYSNAELVPTKEDCIKKIYIDEELGKEAITYNLSSGKEGTIHSEQILEYNKDPDYLKNMLLYKLTIEAQKRIDSCSLSKREISRNLKTSPTQLYRLLDQTNYTKSIGQMLSLLEILNCGIEIVIKDKNIKIA